MAVYVYVTTPILDLKVPVVAPHHHAATPLASGTSRTRHASLNPS